MRIRCSSKPDHAFASASGIAIAAALFAVASPADTFQSLVDNWSILSEAMLTTLWRGVQGYAIARQMEATELDLMHAVFPHPTLSEMMHESVLDAYGRAIHF